MIKISFFDVCERYLRSERESSQTLILIVRVFPPIVKLFPRKFPALLKFITTCKISQFNFRL